MLFKDWRKNSGQLFEEKLAPRLASKAVGKGALSPEFGSVETVEVDDGFVELDEDDEADELGRGGDVVEVLASVVDLDDDVVAGVLNSWRR